MLLSLATKEIERARVENGGKENEEKDFICVSGFSDGSFSD